MPNYQLLVNADDFGRHVLIDQAVKRCVEDGCLRSATLMPGGKALMMPSRSPDLTLSWASASI